MFSMCKIYDGKTYLDKHLVCGDRDDPSRYYTEECKIKGRWVGAASKTLGIDGKSIEVIYHENQKQVKSTDYIFENIRIGRTPDGSEKLTQRSAEGVSFFDFQVSAQKSVSLLAMVIGDDRLRLAHEEASMIGFNELEHFAAYRSGLERLPKITGNLVAARFFHDCSRALDPQLHTHFVVGNVTIGDNGKRFALTESQMVKAIRYAGKVYQSHLAKRCHELGYEIEEKRNSKGIVEGFEIKGVSDELLKKFSKRRIEIETAIAKFTAEHGRKPTAAEISIITKETRSAKMTEITTPELRRRQLEELTSAELSSLEKLKFAAIERNGKQPVVDLTQESLQTAITHSYERHSVIHGHELLAEALNTSLGCVNLEKLKCMAVESADLIELEKKEFLHAYCATREGLELEQWSVDYVNSTSGIFSSFGKTDFLPAEFLSEDQKGVIRKILDSRDGVVSLRGPAGAGKTTTLRELHKGLKQQYSSIIYLTPTNSAKSVLFSEGFTNSETISKFLTRDVNAIPSGSILIIDEAGLQSTRQGAALLRVAESRLCRVIFVGDVRQHVSVEAGDFLRVLETHSNIQTAQLTDIRRQQKKDYRDATKMMASGHAAAGFEAIDRLGWVYEGRGEYIKHAAVDYLRLSHNGTEIEYREGKETKIKVIGVAPTHAEGQAMTELIRQGMKETGKLADGRKIIVAQSLNFTAQQKSNIRNYSPGQLVTFLKKSNGFTKSSTHEITGVESGTLQLRPIMGGREKAFSFTGQSALALDVCSPRDIEICVGDKIQLRGNQPKQKLINGAVLTVSGLEANGSIRTQEGKLIPADFRSFDHGYVSTSHKAQGRTCDYVVVAAQQLDAKALYVSLSRGRKQCLLHTPDKSHLVRGLPRSGERIAALDVLKTAQKPRIPETILARSKYWIQEGFHFGKQTANKIVRTIKKKLPSLSRITAMKSPIPLIPTHVPPSLDKARKSRVQKERSKVRAQKEKSKTKEM